MPSTDPVSVEARLKSYSRASTHPCPPPTLCRWRRDSKATHARLHIHALHWRRDSKATHARLHIHALHRPCVGGGATQKLPSAPHLNPPPPTLCRWRAWACSFSVVPPPTQGRVE